MASRRGVAAFSNFSSVSFLLVKVKAMFTDHYRSFLCTVGRRRWGYMDRSPLQASEGVDGGAPCAG